MTDWYYSDHHNTRLGPVRAQDLADLHANGQLGASTLVWRDGYADWRPWREAMPEVLGAPSATPAVAVPGADAPASAGGNPYEVVERAPASPYAAPRASLTIAPSAAVLGHEVVYAGFWKRYAAYFIDAFIVGIAGFIVQMIVGAITFGGMALAVNPTSSAMSAGATVGTVIGLIAIYVLPIALAAAYFGYFHASDGQASLGKMAVGIKVTDERGGRISFWRGFGRYFALILASIPLGAGLIMTAFTDRKRALQDMICNTVVVDRWAFTADPERQRRDLGAVAIAIIAVSAILVLGYIMLIVFLIIMAAGMSGR